MPNGTLVTAPQVSAFSIDGGRESSATWPADQLRFARAARLELAARRPRARLTRSGWLTRS
jgi:hypothetical protein